jgi:hypothetical protein
LKYFETPRYYNLLLNEWIAKYNRMEERGTKQILTKAKIDCFYLLRIALLNTFCKKGIHL